MPSTPILLTNDCFLERPPLHTPQHARARSTFADNCCEQAKGLADPCRASRVGEEQKAYRYPCNLDGTSPCPAATTCIVRDGGGWLSVVGGERGSNAMHGLNTAKSNAEHTGRCRSLPLMSGCAFAPESDALVYMINLHHKTWILLAACLISSLRTSGPLSGTSKSTRFLDLRTPPLAQPTRRDRHGHRRHAIQWHRRPTAFTST